MKKRYVLGATALVLLGLGTSACSSDGSSGSDNSHSKTASTPKYNTFKGKTFTTKDGVLKIDKVINVKVHDPNLPDSDSNYNVVMITASFKNTSKKSVSPNDFFRENIKLEQKLSNSTHELNTIGGSYDEGLFGKYADLIKANDNKVDPGKTVQVAFDFDLDSKNGDKLVDKYIFQPVDGLGNENGKALTMTATSESLIATDETNTDDSSTDTDTSSDNDTDTNSDSDSSNDTDTDNNSDSNSDSDKENNQSDSNTADTNDNSDTDTDD
ncbi:DUF5067 domain-containing protein [Lactobacillus sp. PV034]|uniref:DUF5067 domain-containing protein n=1 Tax=Lactobacillus sp. PV034 TaxID=2594495 RepID=UPI00223ECBEB|nr:DUF5067 domain-containing protein [Lactobacillus sp. PV034]QNQ80817.1 DUF5067 domain-containing protein [Lactobacillus sp. PV034]